MAAAINCWKRLISPHRRFFIQIRRQQQPYLSGSKPDRGWPPLIDFLKRANQALIAFHVIKAPIGPAPSHFTLTFGQANNTNFFIL
jgi:hypothetical protein